MNILKCSHSEVKSLLIHTQFNFFLIIKIRSQDRLREAKPKTYTTQRQRLLIRAVYSTVWSRFFSRFFENVAHQYIHLKTTSALVEINVKLMMKSSMEWAYHPSFQAVSHSAAVSRLAAWSPNCNSLGNRLRLCQSLSNWRRLLPVHGLSTSHVSLLPQGGKLWMKLQLTFNVVVPLDESVSRANH